MIQEDFGDRALDQVRKLKKPKQIDRCNWLLVEVVWMDPKTGFFCQNFGNNLANFKPGEIQPTRGEIYKSPKRFFTPWYFTVEADVGEGVFPEEGSHHSVQCVNVL